MISDKRTANAVGGKTARACDSCLLKRARWYCSADDAFLCQGCETSVHSANQLASRHTRVRLETSSSKFHASDNQEGAPAWHQGFTRKARTPRQKGERKVLNLNPVDPLVPEVSCEDGSSDENDEQLLCRVPVFDPFAAELCDVVHEHEDGFISSDLDLAQFAADVESLLGEGVDEDHTKGTELLDTEKVDGSKVSCDELEIMKVKEEEEDEGIITACCFDSDFDVTRASLNWCFDEESPMIGDLNQEEEKVVPVAPETPIMDCESKAEMNRNMLLRLNYESVITAWASQGSPWTSGTRPELNPDNFMGSSPEEGIGGIWGYGKRTMITDCEREARVLRYREKRRTRLFSKKIRYQVRKLNAEKRPRIKGRFVKRSSFSGGDCFSYYVNQRNMTAKS